MRYLGVNQCLALYRAVIEASGGAPGLRDPGLLESALARPRAGFGEHELYPDFFSKAAALLEGICRNHPFVDGNKRMAIEAARVFLLMNGIDVIATTDEKVKMVLGVASRRLDTGEVAHWISRHSRTVKPLSGSR